MCPGTLALVALGGQAAGSLMSGIASGNAANYQGAVAANNATIERQNAAYSASAGATQIENAGLKARAQGANVRAGFAGNNLDVNSGSAASVQQSQKLLGQLDTATVAGNVGREVYGYQAQATDYEAQSKLDKAQATYDYLGGAVSAATDIAGGLPTGGGGGVDPSLISSAPSVDPQYAWMSSGDFYNGGGGF